MNANERELNKEDSIMKANQKNLLASIRVHSRLITGIEKKVSGSEEKVTTFVAGGCWTGRFTNGHH
ncbi:MAG: hypothetical protein AB1611_07805 [bacterium]